MQQVEDARNLGRILEEVGELPDAVAAGATKAGDERRLRGVPAIGRGVAGAIPGTRPGDSLVREPRRRR